MKPMTTISYDPAVYKLVPLSISDSSAGILEFGRKQPTHNTYLNLLASIPDQLPGVVVHSGEPVAHGLFWRLGKNDVLQFPVGATAEDCKADMKMYATGDQANMTVKALYTHPAPSQPSDSAAWKCFHCGEAFTDEAHAALHFGTKQQHYPVCTVSAERLRELEALLQSYQEEDTDLHRAMYKMQSGHAIALQREEENGYARGLKDAAKEREDVISMLLQVARAAEQAMENSEENTSGLHWNKADFDILSAAVDKLDALPDDKPGYTLGAAAKASWALNKYRTQPSQPSAEAIVQAALEAASKEPRKYALELADGIFGTRWPDEATAICNASTNMGDLIRAMSAQQIIESCKEKS